MPDNELMHYGVLGMKWGVRKDGMPQGYKGHGPKRKTTRLSKEEKAVQKANKKKALATNKRRHILPEEELDKAIQRLEKERKLRTLTESEVTPGRHFLSEALSPTGRKLLTIASAGLALSTLKIVADVMTDDRDQLPLSAKIRSAIDPVQALRDIRNQGKK